MNEKIENLSWIFEENNRTFSLGNLKSNYQCYDAIDTISDTIRLNSVFIFKILYRRSGVKMKKHYNIMTSTDCNLIKQVEILIYSIGCNIPEAEIDFFIFHRGISMNELGGIDIL